MSKSDEEIAREAVDLQNRGRDYPLFELRGYDDWVARKLEQGEDPEVMAYLDSMSFFSVPEDAATAGDELFDDMLDEVKFSLIKSGYQIIQEP